MRMRLLAIVAIVAVSIAASAVRSAAACPPRAPGYWGGEMCTGTSMTILGQPCLVEICYCYHFANPMVPGDIDEFYIQSIRAMIPGCLPPNPDPVVMDEIRQWLGKLDCRGDLNPEGAGEGVGCAGYKDVKVSHIQCMHNVSQGGFPRWLGCANSGECYVVYRYNCEGCVVERTLATARMGSCDVQTPGNQDCVIICN